MYAVNDDPAMKVFAESRPVDLSSISCLKDGKDEFCQSKICVGALSEISKWSNRHDPWVLGSMSGRVGAHEKKRGFGDSRRSFDAWNIAPLRRYWAGAKQSLLDRKNIRVPHSYTHTHIQRVETDPVSV